FDGRPGRALFGDQSVRRGGDLRTRHQFARRARTAGVHHDAFFEARGTYRRDPSGAEARVLSGGARPAPVSYLPLHPGCRTDIAGTPDGSASGRDSGGVTSAYRGEQTGAAWARRGRRGGVTERGARAEYCPQGARECDRNDRQVNVVNGPKFAYVCP